jgi:hypothetical protein
MSPQASTHDEVIAIYRPSADEEVSLVLGMVAAGMGRPLGWLWIDLSWLDILGGLASPRG